MKHRVMVKVKAKGPLKDVGSGHKFSYCQGFKDKKTGEWENTWVDVLCFGSNAEHIRKTYIPDGWFYIEGTLEESIYKDKPQASIFANVIDPIEEPKKKEWNNEESTTNNQF